MSERTNQCTRDRLSRFAGEYDGDNDTMPGLPKVTWADYELGCLLSRLLDRIEELELKLLAIDSVLSDAIQNTNQVA